MTTGTVERELEAFVHEYAEEFSTGDPTVVTGHFHESAMVIAPGGDLLERLETTHLFRRTDDGWRMVVLAPHDG